MAIFKVTNGNDSGEGSLRNAIALANAAEGADEIQIDVKNISLESEIQISDALTITGNDATINQIGQEAILYIDDLDDNNFFDVQLSNLTLTGGDNYTAGGAIQVFENLTIDNLTFKDNNAPELGGAIYAELGNLEIKNSLFENNTATPSEEGESFGASISVFNSENVVIENTIFNDNSAVFSNFYGDNIQLTIRDSEVKNSTSEGLLLFDSEVHITNSLFENNSESGIVIVASNLEIESVTSINNSSLLSGGGLFVEESNGSIHNSRFEDNTANEGGGGIFIGFDSHLNITNSIVEGNHALIGSGIETLLSSAAITDTLISDNTGSAIQLEGGNLSFFGSNVDNPNGTQPEGIIGYVEPELPSEEQTTHEPPTQELLIEETPIEQLPNEELPQQEPSIEELLIEETPIELLTEEPGAEESATEELIEPSLDLTTVNRFYQGDHGFHFYSADAKEVTFIQDETAQGNLHYNYEGESFQALASDQDALTGETIEGAEAVYRLLNESTGAHLFTIDENEKDFILENSDNYSLEGTAYYAFDAEQEGIETIPVYRLLNTLTGTHLFTTDSQEFSYVKDNLDHFNVEADDGIAFHVIEV